MSKSFSDQGKAGRDWRLLMEIAQPPEWQDEHWVNIGLTAALDAIHLAAPDEERLENATVEAVARARRCRTTLDPVPRLVVVRVLVSSPVAGSSAPYCWGFFVIERVACARDAANANVDGTDEQSGAHVVELYIYADARAA